MDRPILDLMKYMLSLITIIVSFLSYASAEPENPIVFVTQVPKPDDFANIVSTFGNHLADPQRAPRGGDLWIRYPDGTLKNLTEEAGYGESGLQGSRSITVRDPAVHWSGEKILFSMVIGAPSQYEVESYRFQLYEVSGLGKNETPQVSYLEGQPREYNNVMGVYVHDGVVFASDRPRGGLSHLYPQLDEYESTPTNTGLWKLENTSLKLTHLDHSPSGDFHPILDSFGRIIFSRWDHLQQDQQAESSNFGALNYASESRSAAQIQTRREVFPEARSEGRRDSNELNLHTFNHFFPWMMNQDGTELETLNHIGRHELVNYFPQSFFRERELQEFIFSVSNVGENEYPITNLFHFREDPTVPGRYFATNAPEFYTHSSGQIIRIDGAPNINPNKMKVVSVTHPHTSEATNTPSNNHSGLYRNPLPLSNGSLVASHTSETKIDINTGSRGAPRSRYDYRVKILSRSGRYYSAGTPLTNGIYKEISYYDPDVLVRYSGNLWELQPVEVVTKSPPPVVESEIPAIELGVFQAENVAIDSFREYLVSRDLALIISRDLRRRDGADKQQPFNLTLGAGRGGKRNIAGLQLFEGLLIRGYSNFVQGRRPLASYLQSITIPTQFTLPAAPSTYRLESDGSVAALVPANRALTWQLVNSDGDSVVRERLWVTFQPGEIRVCASCHGINEEDQLGRTPPRNSPQALARLLDAWKKDRDLVIPGEIDGDNNTVTVRIRRGASRRTSVGKLIIQIQANDSSLQPLRLTVSDRSGRVRRSREIRLGANGKKRVTFRMKAKILRRSHRVLLYQDDTVISSKTVKKSR